MTEDEMAGWHHRLNGHEFKQTSGDSGGQRSLVLFSPWGCRESDKTEHLTKVSSLAVKKGCCEHFSVRLLQA